MDQLALLDKILIRQKMELLEIITSIETNNQYALCDPEGRQFLLAVEETSYCARQCCADNRTFMFGIVDATEEVQIRVTRRYAVNYFQCCNCSRCCRDSIMVEFPPGNPVGYVVQESTCCNIILTVRNVNEEAVLVLKGPTYCLCTCPGTVRVFNILTADQTAEVGKLLKIWSGLFKELLTDADNFELQVPADMPLEHKVLLIGAVLLIDFMFFEDNEVYNHKNILY